MNPLNWIRRINAELAELAEARERNRQIKLRRALHKRRVVMPRPQSDERSSIEQHRRIVSP